MTSFSDIHCCIYADIVVGGSEKSPKLCWRNTCMVSNKKWTRYVSIKIDCILCMLFTNYQASKHLSRTKKVSGIYWTKLSYWSIYYIFRPQPSSPYLDLQETILYFLKHSQETGAILEVPLHTVIFSPKFVSYFNVKGSN